MIIFMTKFIILTTARTGSTMLVKALQTHPEIVCTGENFLLKRKMVPKDFRFPFWKFPFLPNKVQYALNLPKLWFGLNRFLDDFYSGYHKERVGIKAKGFKLMVYQTYFMPGIFQYLKKNNIKVIVLFRENILKNALSLLRAIETGIYRIKDGNTVRLPKLYVDVNLLEKQMGRAVLAKKELEVKTASLDRLKIAYEDFQNWDASVNKILKFLGVSSIPLAVATKKINPDKLEDMVENYDEMIGWIKQKGYGRFL
jgi:hypothetical protein